MAMMDPAPPEALRPSALPRHVAVIMDGNGRWASARGLPRIEGHRVGAESVRSVTRTARKLGIQALTLYAFSAQNWARPPAEVAALMELLRDYLVGERGEILDNDIRLRAIGDTGRLPAIARDPLEALIADSADNSSMILTLALSYGGRESIAAACRQAMIEVKSGQRAPESMEPEAFSALLPTAALPPLDLVIRTSGERRLSNFLLWEAAYAELYFTDELWPDFRRESFAAALRDYEQRERRFGQTSAQLDAGHDTMAGEKGAIAGT
ncbi:MAG TPA: polyprenyl diphosphate synthase [Kofleriaceae bacterium]|nr:polyprenyl diphosphate synthase [Kofleriaceae bacterium]